MKLTTCTLLLLATATAEARRQFRTPKHRRLTNESSSDSGDFLDEFENVTIGIGIDNILDFNVEGCFSAKSTVQVLGREAPVAMEDLQVGDHILTNCGSKSGGVYEPVYAFGHFDPTTVAKFVQIQTSAKNVLEMTGEHLVFTAKDKPVRADSLQVGDALVGGAVVTKVSSIQRPGLYAPFTPSGTLMVNGIQASSYISLQESTNHVQLKGGLEFTIMSQHDFLHAMVSPFRMMCLGISSSLCQTSNHDSSSGMPLFVEYGIQFAKWCDAHLPLAAQLVLLIVSVLVGGMFMTAESLFGAEMAPMVFLGVLGTVAVLKASNMTVRTRKVKTV